MRFMIASPQVLGAPPFGVVKRSTNWPGSASSNPWSRGLYIDPGLVGGQNAGVVYSGQSTVRHSHHIDRVPDPAVRPHAVRDVGSAVDGNSD